MAFSALISRNCLLAVLMIISCSTLSAQTPEPVGEEESPNYGGATRCDWSEIFGLDEKYFDVKLVDGRYFRNCISIVRLSADERRPGDPQFLRFSFVNDSQIRDTVVEIRDSLQMRIGRIGMGPPILMTIYPAMEFQRTAELDIPQHFFELLGGLGYGGADESQQAIGFDNMYFSAEALLGRYFTSNLAFAAGGGIMLEGGRDRYEAMGHLRWRFTSEEARQQVRFEPGPCQFEGVDDLTPLARPGEGWRYSNSYRRLDSTVHMLHDSTMAGASPEIFLFAEGGLIFDGNFEGCGDRPAINPEDYNEWFAGGGIGFIFDWFTVNLSYRRSRINLRTPCENCDNEFIVNTNNVNAALLRLGWHLDW